MSYKVFCFGDDVKEWIAAVSKESALMCFEDMVGSDGYDVEIKEMAKAEIDTLTIRIDEPYYGDDEDVEPATATFKESVENRLLDGERLPFVIASSEW